MTKEIGLFRKSSFSLAALVSSLGLSGECYIPNTNIYWPTTKDMQTVGIPDEQTPISPDEAFTKKTAFIQSFQSGYISSAEPGMVSAYSHPLTIRIADSDSPYGLCIFLTKFDLSGHERDTITSARLVLCLDSDAQNQSTGTLRVNACEWTSPWESANLSYRSLSGSCVSFGEANYSISNNIPNTPVILDLTRVLVDVNSSGGYKHIVQKWADNPSENNGILIRSPFENGSSGQFRTFKKWPDEKPTLEIEYIRYTEN